MQAKMTAGQAAIFLFIFTTSSSIINIPNPLITFAGNAAWISLLASAMIGLLLIIPVCWLAKAYPGKNFIECGYSVVGRPVTILLGLPFLYYQIHMGAAIVLDIAMFLRNSMMRETPSYWFVFFTFFVIAISVRSGIDKLTGLFPLLMANIMLFICLILIMSYTNYDFHQLLPIMPDGIRPVLHGIYYTTGFPYVEVVLFTMILPLVGSFGKKFGLKLAAAILLNALSLTAVTVAAILVFGPIAGDRKYSLFEVARTVNAVDVFQRIEALIGFSLIVASFMKATIVLFTAHQTCAHLIGRKDDKMLIYPITALMAIISVSVLLGGDANWDYIVTSLHPMIGITFGAIPVLIVFLVALIRSSGKKDGEGPMGGLQQGE